MHPRPIFYTPCSGVSTKETDILSSALDFARSADAVFDLYNNAPCGYYALDAAGLFLRINNTQLRWLGYTRDALVGRLRLADVLAAEPRDGGAADREKDAAGVGCRFVRCDGTTFDAFVSTTVGDGSTRGGCRATVFDLSAGRCLSRARFEREQFIDRVRAVVPDLLSGCDRLTCPDNLPGIAAHIGRVCAACNAVANEVEYHLRRGDGAWRAVHSCDTVFGGKASDAVPHYIGVVRDVIGASE